MHYRIAPFLYILRGIPGDRGDRGDWTRYNASLNTASGGEGFYIMASSCAWLSVLVKQGQSVIKCRTVVKCSWEDTFGSLLDKFKGLSDRTIEKIQISKNESFIDPVHVVPIDAPVSLYNQFGCVNVCVFIAESEVAPMQRDVKIWCKCF